MSDRELLKLAAKAAGIDVPKQSPWSGIDESGIWKDISGGGDGTRFWTWNPLKNDGDALRLAVKLNEFEPYKSKGGFRLQPGLSVDELCRAIVRAAAEIGKAMP